MAVPELLSDLLTFASPPLMPLFGLLLLALLPRGDFLRSHMLFLRNLRPSPLEKSGCQAESDLRKWGLLDISGRLDLLGVERVIVLVGATSPSAVVRDLGDSDPLSHFYREVYAVAAGGPSEFRHNLDLFLEVLKDACGARQSDTGKPDVAGSMANSSAVKSSPLVDLAERIHSLVRTSSDLTPRPLFCGELSLRPTVSLIPALKPVQARVLWSVRAPLPPPVSLASVPVYLDFFQNASGPASAPSGSERRLPAFLFGIYLGGSRVRISLFAAPHPNADGQRRWLVTYAKLLALALDRDDRRTSVRPTVRGPSPEVGGAERKTFVASWILPEGGDPLRIVQFTSLVWQDLLDAMRLVAFPNSAFLEKVAANSQSEEA